jgi:hypothetical protein
MTINFDTYEMIADLLAQGTEFDPTYSIEEIAMMANVSVDIVRYVDQAEQDD